MTLIYALAGALALAIGVVLGMLGGGGAIFTLPMLIYVLGIEPKKAIAMSLFVVGSTSSVASFVYARAGSVRWRMAGIVGVAASGGAYTGGRLAHFVPAAVLLVLFGLSMVVASLAMMKGTKKEADDEEHALHIGRAIVLGVAVGLFSGLVGAGGGFLFVPTLTLFGGLSLRDAIGTSLVIITMQSFAGFAGHIGQVELDWTLVLSLSGAASFGSVVGTAIGKRVSTTILRRGFAWLILAMAFFMFVQHLPLAIALVAVGATLLLVVLVIRPFSTSRSTPSEDHEPS